MDFKKWLLLDVQVTWRLRVTREGDGSQGALRGAEE